MNNHLIIKLLEPRVKSSIVADKLSRFHFQKARQVAPWLNPIPAEIPEHLLTI